MSCKPSLTERGGDVSEAIELRVDLTRARERIRGLEDEGILLREYVVRLEREATRTLTVLDMMLLVVAKLGKWDPTTGAAQNDYAQIADDARLAWRRLYLEVNPEARAARTALRAAEAKPEAPARQPKDECPCSPGQPAERTRGRCEYCGAEPLRESPAVSGEEP